MHEIPQMPNYTVGELPFAKLGRREIEARFDGSEVSSDGGLLKQVAPVLHDPRSPLLVRHTTEQMLRQRVFGLCQGYEDLSDHDQLKNDLALQTALRGKSAHGAKTYPEIIKISFADAFQASINAKSEVESTGCEISGLA